MNLTTYAWADANTGLYFKPYVSVAPSLYQLDLGGSLGSSTTRPLGAHAAFGADVLPNLAVEIRLGGSGSDKANLAGSSYTSKIGFPLASVFLKPVVSYNEWRLCALFGATQPPSYSVQTSSGTTVKSSGNKFLSLGLGAGYQFDKNIQIGLELVQYHAKMDISSVLNAKLSAVSLVFSYSFDDGSENLKTLSEPMTKEER